MSPWYVVHYFGAVSVFEAILNLLNLELEHFTEVDQLYHRYGHEYYHIHSVRYIIIRLQNLAADVISLSIQQIFWQQMTVDLHVTYSELTQSMSVNYVGLAMGCVLFIPFAKKYGRRPVYIVSTALMLVTSFWTARLTSLAELYICNLLQGLAGATNEAIVEITVCSLLSQLITGSQLTTHRLQIYSLCTIEAR